MEDKMDWMKSDDDETRLVFDFRTPKSEILQLIPEVLSFAWPALDFRNIDLPFLQRSFVGYQERRIYGTVHVDFFARAVLDCDIQIEISNGFHSSVIRRQ